MPMHRPPSPALFALLLYPMLAFAYPTPAFPQTPQGQPPPRPQVQRPARTAPGTARPQPGVRPGPGQPGGPRPPVQPPRPTQPPRPAPPPRPGRPPQWGRPPQGRPSYAFRPADRNWLRHHYRNRLGYINRSRRPRFIVGGYFPYRDIGYLSRLPPAVYGYLPPPPPGYQMGYWDGYVIVYDPATYFIANLIDLL